MTEVNIMKDKELKKNDPVFHAYTIVRGESQLHYQLIRLHLRGKVIERVEVVLDEILPIVVGKAAQLMRKEGLECQSF